MEASSSAKGRARVIGQADVSEGGTLLEQVQDLYFEDGIDGVLERAAELRSVAGCQALVELGHGLRFEDPHASAACMAFAEILASQLGAGELGERELEDFRCEMSLELVWSWLDLKRLAHAEAALGRAAERVLRGTCSPIQKARILDTWTVYYGLLGDFDKARQAARAALANYEMAGERHFQGRILYRLSIIKERSGKETKREDSLRCARESLARLDAATEPDLYLRVTHQEIGCLVELERYREARIRLFESLGHFQEHGDAANTIERAMLEGLSNARLGKTHAAQRELIAALCGLRAAGDAYFFGVLALELCALFIEQGFETGRSPRPRSHRRKAAWAPPPSSPAHPRGGGRASATLPVRVFRDGLEFGYACPLGGCST
jgi:tetratricopeptide (TPR) repeat protein